MKILTKSLLSAGAAAAALVSAAAPAEARNRYDDDHISAGEVIAGAVVLGGLAAIIASSDNDRRDRDYRYNDRDYDRGGYDRGGYDRGGYNYYNGGSSRQAISQCVNQVEGWADRYSRSDVTKITDIDRTRYGYRVKGNIVVRDGWNEYGRNSRDYRGGYNRGYDKGSFTCYVERGRVVDVSYRGLDRWR